MEMLILLCAKKNTKWNFNCFSSKKALTPTFDRILQSVTDSTSILFVAGATFRI
jgi:hypothetical protein